MTDIVVIGSAHTDFITHVEEFPTPDRTTTASEFYAGAGGKGGNKAVAVARMGASVTLLACVGNDDRGRDLLETWQAEGININHIRISDTEPTGVVMKHVLGGNRSLTSVMPGANARLNVPHIQQAADLLRGAKIVMVQPGVPMNSVIEAVNIAQNAQVILDPSPPDEVSDLLLSRVTLIKPNRKEAEAMTGMRVMDQESAKEAMQYYLEKGVKAAAIQANNTGNFLMTDEGDIWMPHLDVESVDFIGAGDALAAGLAVMMAEGKSWAEAAPFANAAAALTTTKLGAFHAFPTRDEIMALL
jgi:ribokinase